MPQYQLVLTASLVAAATVSGAVFYHQRPATGKIALDDSFEGDEPELAGEKDPFDVTTAEDTIDGTPLNAEHFWLQVSTTSSKYGLEVNIEL